MTSGELVAAVRQHKGKLFVPVWTNSGEDCLWVAAVKGDFIQTVRGKWPDRSEETGMSLLGDGSIDTVDEG